MRCADHPEWVLPTNWTIAPARPVLEVVLSLADGIEIRPYTGGFVAMVGDGVGGQPDWPHIGVALMKPRARGRITVLSAEPAVAPRIEHQYDSEPADVADLTRGMEIARELGGAATQVGQPLWSTSQHLCGSAPIGPDGDSEAVVDSRCRVRGVEGLWVIDGSVMPTIPSRGPHATTVMLGHRAAEFVRRGERSLPAGESAHEARVACRRDPVPTARSAPPRQLPEIARASTELSIAVRKADLRASTSCCPCGPSREARRERLAQRPWWPPPDRFRERR